MRRSLTMGTMGEPNVSLVLKVNEAYHDVEGHLYQGKHPEIFEDEKKTWSALIDFIRLGEKPFTLLDFGTGTGFVPLQIGKRLRQQDVLLCADISQGMLDACRHNVSKAGFACRMEFLKVEGGRIKLADQSLDCITMNAVLHHMPDVGFALREADRLLKPGGRLLIAHEPNAAFYRNLFLRLNSLLLSPRLFAGAVLRRLRLYETFRRFFGKIQKGYGRENKMLEEVNRRLMSEKAIDTPLSYDRLYELLDVQSPDLGGTRLGLGIDLMHLKEDFLPTYVMDSYSTYNHLCFEEKKKRRLAVYERVLKWAFPLSGSGFSAVLRKPGA